MAKTIATLKAKDAKLAEIEATIHVAAHVTRWYIWMFKLRNIWAIIRVKVERDNG